MNQSMKQRTLIEWCPHDASLFAVGAENLRLFETTILDSTDSMDPSAMLLTTQRKRSFRMVQLQAKVTQLKCMQWHPFASTPLMIAAGMGTGKIVLSDFQDSRARIVREFVPKYPRPCNAVAWNTSLPQHLAAGFEKVRSDFCTLVWDVNASSATQGQSNIMGSAVATGSVVASSNGLVGAGSVVGSANVVGVDSVDPSSSGVGGSTGSSGASMSGNSNGSNQNGVGSVGTRSFSREGEKPLHELANSEATVALSWVPLQPTCLATGTGFKWLRIYDLRTKGSSPLSVVAHNKMVLGVVFDEHRPHLLATYSDAPQDPVKVWDIRRLETSTGPLVSLQQSSRNLTQVSWCPSKPGIVVTSSAEEKWISLWDVNKQDSESSTAVNGINGPSTAHIRKPFRRRYTSDPLSAFSWQNVHVASPPSPKRSLAQDEDMKQIMAAAFPNRLLTVSMSGEIEDISVHDSMPVSVSSNGELAFSCGKVSFSGAYSTTSTAPDGSNSSQRVEDDISKEMHQLARQGYSVVVTKSLKLFNPNTQRHRQLNSLWRWVDHIEALRRARVTQIAQSGGVNGIANAGPLRGWPCDSHLLVVAGVKNLLSTAAESATNADAANSLSFVQSPESSALNTITSVMKTDPVLGCPMYDGLGRRLALLACNWDPDNGQGGLGSGPSSLSLADNGQGNGSNRNLSLHRSNSGVWNAQKTAEDGPGFGARSWYETTRHELRGILSKCETEGNHMRGAALAVFHGDLNAAVMLLQKGATWLNQRQGMNSSVPLPVSSDVLQLVAMAVAGYSSSAAMSMGGQSLWSTMCQQLLKREEIQSTTQPRYLHALLSFLCVTSSYSSANNGGPNAMRSNAPPQPRRTNNRRAWGSVDGLSLLAGPKPPTTGVYSSILNDASLPLSDRIAFACRYLPGEDLRAFITLHEDDCEQFGRLDGLLITGMNATGLRLLQTYLDLTGDIQTLALLAARLPSAHVSQVPSVGRWILLYQDILNQWQLFHERARFDVGRAQLEDVLVGIANYARDPDGNDLKAELAAPTSISIPPQLYVRCNFCNASLSLANLLRLGGSHSSWLNRAKPKLTCCPSCRKPLPQCALCLLPFGSLNPYFELAHRRSKQTADAVNSAVANVSNDAGMMMIEDPAHVASSGNTEHENLAQLSSIPFVEWFTWCQSCKHGGHAHHIAEWFETRRVCPVTDCGCRCQHLDLPVERNAQMEQQQQMQLQQLQIQKQQQELQALSSPPDTAPVLRAQKSEASAKRAKSFFQQKSTSISNATGQQQMPPGKAPLPPTPLRTGSAGPNSGGMVSSSSMLSLLSAGQTGSNTLEMPAGSESFLSLGSKLDQLEKDTSTSGGYKFI